MIFSLRSVLLGFIFAGAVSAAEPTPPPPAPWMVSSYTFETGVLWEIGTGTIIPYRLVPTQFSWRSPEAFGWSFANGARLTFRNRIALIGTWVQHGPESHYLAFSGSPSVELWNKAGTWSLFTGSGGGFGVIDSRGIKGGMGQDFTLNWFIRGGIEHVLANGSHLSAGIMYQHMSNGGATKPNPGIDALGFTLGYTLKY